MPKVNVSYTDFSSGEISPKLYGRFDLSAYYSGHKRIENFIVESVGQANFRNGTVFSAETAGNNPAFLYTWSYNDDISFILEFTNLKLRFFNNDGIVESGGSPYEVATPYTTADLFQLKFAQDGVDMYITHPSYNPRKLTYTSATSWSLTSHSPIRETFGNFQRISAVTKADPAVLTYTGADSFSNGQKIKITGALGMTELNDEFFLVSNLNTGAKTFELQNTSGVDIDSTGYATYTANTGIITPIIESAAPFLSSGNYPACVGFYEERLIYGGSNNNPQTLYFSRSADFDDFSIGDEVDDGIEYTVLGTGNYIRWLKGTNKFLAIGVYGDVLQATGGIDGVITPSSISIRPSNSYGVLNINPLGKNTNIFYMQDNGITLRSFEFQFETDSYIPVDRNVIADHITDTGIAQIDFQEGRPNIIWAVKNNGQLVGMTLEESESVSGWHRHNTDGEFTSVASLPRENADNQLWVCAKRTINGSTKYYIEFFEDSVKFPNINDFYTGNKTTDKEKFLNKMFEAQKEYIYVDSSLTYLGTAEGVSASASITPAATSGTSVTFTASASVFVSGDVGREIWKKSTSGAETGRAVITGYTSATVVTCTIIENFDSTNAIAAGDWYFTTDTVTGLDHLEGKKVTIIADGGQHPVKTVSSGSITLDRQVSVCHVGLAYNGYIETNSLEGGGASGPAQTKKKSLGAVGIRFLNSLYAKVGENYYNLQQIYERTASMKMDRPPIPYTGDKKIIITNKVNDEYDGGWQRQKNVIIQQSNPFPCNVQLIIPYINVSDV